VPDANADRSMGRVDDVLVIVAPGQGAQSPGFLTPWLEDDTFRARFEWLSTVAGVDLIHYGTEADADAIRATEVAQPLLVATGLVAALGIFPHPTDAFGKVSAVAGHSVGELTAAAGARVITAEQAMVLVRERGKAMADAAASTPTGMTAVLGGDRDEVLAAIDKHGLTAANDNGPGQIVAAGTLEQLSAFAEEPPGRARLMPLSVAGAFHTEHMAPAVGHLASLARSVSVHDPRTRVISNRDGRVVHSGVDVLARIVGQIASPVRWDLCMDTMLDLGVTGVLEMPPAGTLTGIAKRAMKGVETFALKTPDQLDEARAFCDKHGEFAEMDTTPTWRMVVAPSKGTFRVSPEAADAAVLAAGAPVGDLASSRDSVTITTEHGGQVVEWLVEDGDLVSPGQPLVRLHPEGAA
jgi:[acyl-carrier-protein] S-malonyltransferase